MRTRPPANCHCGCFGNTLMHEAGARVRRVMLVEIPAERSKPVVAGKKTQRAGFGLKPEDVGLDVAEEVEA